MPTYFLAQLVWVAPFALAMVALSGPVQEKSGPAALALLLGFALFIFLSIRLALTPPVATQEAIGPLAIIRRSWDLTSGNWWRLFGFLVVFVIGAGILVLATIAIVGVLVKSIFGDFQPLTPGALILSLAEQIVIAGAYVVMMAMLSRLYVQATGAEASVPSSGT
jgi:membrane-anchored glycerophosphoryl diester phosphodiesterase (GDPDase)